MECVRGDVDSGELIVADRGGFWILAVIDATGDAQSGAGCGGDDQLHNHLMADQRPAAQVLGDEGEQSVLDAVPLCALPRRIDVVGASPTRQLSLQPEAPGADQEATNGLKHFGKRSLWGSAGHTGRSTREHQRGLERINVRADPPVERAGRCRQASERDMPLTVSPGYRWQHVWQNVDAQQGKSVSATTAGSRLVNGEPARASAGRSRWRMGP